MRFIKDAIDTWRADPRTGYPMGFWQDASGFYQRDLGVLKHGVYQHLFSIAGNEIIDADSD